MRISFIHASTTFQERVRLWSFLKDSNYNHTSFPWLCIGDFNEVLYHWEKFWRKEVHRYRIAAFRDFLDACSLMDIESKGCVFTWSNNREGNALVKKRLDRAICNMEWWVLYPNVEAFAFLAIGSDHSPILLSLNPTKLKRKKMFRFETYWLEHSECEEVVKKAWHTYSADQPTMVVKTKKVTADLTRWSRRNFKNARQQLIPLKQRLQELTNSTDEEQNREEARYIARKIEDLW
ncbi:hypothetical protein ACJRO7_022887 [Eucalyptus globulus]|uniref:Exo_endo_phos domain-containing protein n=1 Tax=Eucalyptus globulus TaxID=34317 RepID=A0ABD3K4F5_EUCGL